jgi:hypothetical protein
MHFPIHVFLSSLNVCRILCLQEKPTTLRFVGSDVCVYDPGGGGGGSSGLCDAVSPYGDEWIPSGGCVSSGGNEGGHDTGGNGVYGASYVLSSLPSRFRPSLPELTPQGSPSFGGV